MERAEPTRSGARADAKSLILDLIATAGGAFAGTIRLNKAFYFAHLYFWQEEGAVLTTWPIVRLPMGPAIDDYTVLLDELVHRAQPRECSADTGPWQPGAHREVFDCQRIALHELAEDKLQVGPLRQASGRAEGRYVGLIPRRAISIR